MKVGNRNFSLLRTFVSICAAGLVIILIAAYLVNSNLYSAWLKEKILALAQSDNHRVSVREVGISGLGLAAKQLEIFQFRPPLLVQLDELSIRPKFLALLGGELKLKFDGRLYAGLISGEISLPGIDNKLSLVSSLSDLQLQSIPLFAGLGIESGSLSIPKLEIMQDSSKLSSASGELLIRNLNKKSITQLGPALTRLPLAVNLPPIEALNFDLTLALVGNHLTISKINSSSSWGNISGQASIILASRSRLKYSFAGSAQMLPIGQEIITPFWPFFGSPETLPATDQFKFEGSSELPPPGLRLRPFHGS